MTYQPKTYRDNGGDRYVIADGGVINIEQGGEVHDDQPVGSSVPSLGFLHEISLPTSTGDGGSTNSITVAQRIQIVDAWFTKTGAGSSASTGSPTVQLKTSTGGAISDAIDVKKVVGAVVRAASIDRALGVIDAGGTIKAVRAALSSSVNNAGIVSILAVKRST